MSYNRKYDADRKDIIGSKAVKVSCGGIYSPSEGQYQHDALSWNFNSQQAEVRHQFIYAGRLLTLCRAIVGIASFDGFYG